MVTMNMTIAIVIFLLLLLGLYFLSRRMSGDTGKIENFEQAASQGDVYSQFRLGQLYYEGKGVEKNDEKAAQWLLKAAQQDHSEAQYILATMYEKGAGVEQNDKEAFKWFSKAACQGHERAFVMLDSGKWSAYMPVRVEVNEPLPCQSRKEDVRPDEALPEETETPQAPQGQVEPDLEQKYLLKAEQGDVDAQYNLGIMYYHGEGVSKDLEKALHWFHVAAEQDDADAQYNLGLMYGKGEAVKKDHRQSVQWFQKASDQGHAGAKEILGKMFKKS
jgi:hypothetical protein